MVEPARYEDPLLGESRGVTFEQSWRAYISDSLALGTLGLSGHASSRQAKAGDQTGCLLK
jgi:hypothetical protein